MVPLWGRVHGVRHDGSIMPWAPKRDRGCIAPRGERDAANNAARRNDPAQAEADRLRRSARWQHTRAYVLREEPLCRVCVGLGYTVEAQEVDHILPIVTRPDLAYTLENLQPLCRTHHAAKSARERAAR